MDFRASWYPLASSGQQARASIGFRLRFSCVYTLGAKGVKGVSPHIEALRHITHGGATDMIPRYLLMHKAGVGTPAHGAGLIYLLLSIPDSQSSSWDRRKAKRNETKRNLIALQNSIHAH